MTYYDPILNMICKQNNLSPSDFISDRELHELGEPDEEVEEGDPE